MTVRFFIAVMMTAPFLLSCATDQSPTAPPVASTETGGATAPEAEGGESTVPSPTSGSAQDAEATSSTTVEPQASLELRADGLGVVNFGQPKDEVVGILQEVIGSPPTDPGNEADWVEYIGWRDLGLYIGFDTPQSTEYTGASRFVGWDSRSPDALRITTDDGIGIGDTIAEARSVYGDRFQVPIEPDECLGDWTYLLTSASGEVELVGTLDHAPDDDARIATAHAGIGVGC